MRRRLIAASLLAALLGGCGTTTTSNGPGPAAASPTTAPGAGTARRLPVIGSAAGLSPLPWSDPVVAGDVVSVRTSWGGCRSAPVAATAAATAAGVALGIWDRRSGAQVCADFVVVGRVSVQLPAALAGRPLGGAAP